MSARSGFLILLAGLIAAAGAAAKDTKPTLKSVGDGVICQCGCNQTVTTCNHVECSSRAEMSDLIQKKIAEKKDETTILQDLVLRYGVKVLASPPAKGFTLTVWILPGVGLVVGLGAVILVVRKWRKPAAGASAAPPAPVDPKVLAAVEEEMKRIAG